MTKFEQTGNVVQDALRLNIALWCSAMVNEGAPKEIVLHFMSRVLLINAMLAMRSAYPEEYEKELEKIYAEALELVAKKKD